MTLHVRPLCECAVLEERPPAFDLCGTCYPMVTYHPREVLLMECCAARILFNLEFEGTPDEFFVAEDGSIIVGKDGVGHVRAISGELFETGSIDESGNWQGSAADG